MSTHKKLIKEIAEAENIQLSEKDVKELEYKLASLYVDSVIKNNIEDKKDK